MKNMFRKQKPLGPVELEYKHPLAIRWFHWLNMPLLAVMIWSGLLIYWANSIYGVRIGDKEIVHVLPNVTWKGPKGTAYDLYGPPAPSWVPSAITVEGDSPQDPRKLYQLDGRLADGMAWHFFFMWFFTLNGLLYVLYTSISGQWRYLVPQKGTLKHAFQTVLHDLHIRKTAPPRQKFNGAQQIAYSMIIVMGLFSVLTGIAIYKPTQVSWLTGLFGGYMAARFIHFWLMMGYLLFFLIHIAQVIRAGWNNFRAMICGYELVPVEPETSAATGGGS
jgi:thiosulfate reductase cytochrome b subunit